MSAARTSKGRAAPGVGRKKRGAKSANKGKIRKDAVRLKKQKAKASVGGEPASLQEEFEEGFVEFALSHDSYFKGTSVPTFGLSAPITI